MIWLITVQEEDDTYYYRFESWDEVITKLVSFDGYAVEYSITHRTMKGK